MIESDLSNLALAAAKELDRRLNGSQHTAASRAFATALVQSFANDEEDGLPILPLESVGFVCTVLENYVQLSKPATYQQLREGAKRAAEQLLDPNLSPEKVKEIIGFCVDLYYAARERQEISDFPRTHPELVTLG